MTTLPNEFKLAPLAHRALHDVAAGRPENSIAAVTAAIDRGYGIEIDVQMSRDGQAMVFHDYDLGRLTDHKGPVFQNTARELGQIGLSGSKECIPTLGEVLDVVAGRVAVLIEIKDQDGALGPNVGALEKAVAEALMGYRGPVAVLSFNPYSIAAMADFLPDLAGGLATGAFPPNSWLLIPAARRRRLRQIPDFKRVGASFISHKASDLNNPRVADLKAQNVPVLCWTIKNQAAEDLARQVADNITFEGYDAAIPET